MSNRTAVLVAIVDEVEASRVQQKPIDVDAAARLISSKFPQSGMTIEEIEQVVAGMATKAGVPVLQVSKAA